MQVNILEESGLSKRESEVYLVLVRTGPCVVSRIAKETGLHRSNIYDTLEQLQEKGLVSFVIKNNTKQYTAAKPERILGYLEEKMEKVRAILPEIKKLENTLKEETEIQVFKGKEGFKTVLNIILEDGFDYIWFGGCQEVDKIFHLELVQFLNKVTKKGMRGRIIERKGAKFPLGKKETARFITKDFISLSSNAVWGNKTAIFISTPPFYIVLIKNKEIANSNKKVFEFLWSQAKNKRQNSKN